MPIVQTFQARQGARISHEDARIAGEFLVAQFGKVGAPARAVVDAARPEDSPIHDQFEWDDSEAAEQYRIAQARRLVRSIEVVTFVKGAEIERVPAFERVVIRDTKTKDAVPKYLNQQIVWSRADLSEQVIQRLVRETQALARRLREYGIKDQRIALLADGVEEALEAAFGEEEAA